MWHCRPAMSTFLAVVLALAMVSDVAAKATLRNNGYEDLTISLDEPDSIKPKECGQLVENIKALIRSFSASLFRATDQLAFVRSARIILPSWWEAGQCGLGRSQVQPVRADEKADITVVGQNFFEEPKFPEVIQHRGCGLPGKDFFLPLSFIWDLNQTDAILGNPGRLLVREWAKYRYGVFEELGVQENPMYPTFYSPEDGFDSDLGEEEIPTSCNNKIPAGNKMCNTGSCFFRPDPMDTETNSKIDSSLMSFPNLPNVEKFCNQETHNRDAPTRQNVLCSGRSIWEVMTRHPDFQGKKRMPEGAFMEPEFRFVSRENRKIVFLLDSTSGHNGVAGLWPIIARATYRLLEELQESRDYDRVELGLVEFAGSIEKSERLTSVRLLDINSKSFISRYPARNSSEPCLSCAFHKAEDLVGRDLMTYSEIVVVTQGFAAGQSKFSNPRSSPSSTHLDDTDVVDSESEHDIGSSPYGGVAPRTSGLGDEHDPIFDQLPNAGAKIHAIQLSGEPHPMLKDLTARSGGRFSAVEDASEEAATFMELLSFYESVFQIANPSKLMQTVFRPTRPYDVLSGNFYVDSSINQGLLFVAHYPANEAPSAVKVRSPTGQLYDRVLLPKVPYVADVIRVETHIETGQWTFEVESISTRALGLEIVGYGPKTETSPVRVEFWSSWDDGDDRNPQNAPLMFFVSVRRGREPLTKVQVRAVVERISDDLTDNVTVVLTDDGRGDPDITSGDGIYSGYFTEFLRSSGQYRVRISAVRDGFNGEAFQREIPGGIFKLSHAPSDDVYPPNLITDLRVVTHPGNQTFELTWTAPGGDYNKGKATRYELRYANDWNSLRGDNFPSAENLKTRPPNPQGAQERIAFNTGEHGLSPGKVFYFAIRAHDGWWGPISRPVKAYLKPAPTLKPPSASQEGISGFDDDGLSGGGILSSGAGFLNLEVIAIIAGCVVLGVLVISSTLCYFVVFSKKKGKNKRDKSDSYQTSSAVAVTVGDGKAEPDLIVRSPTHHPHHQQTTLKMDKCGEIDSVTELETLPESYSYYPRGVGVGGPAMSGDMLDGNGMLAGSTPSPRSSHFMGNGNLGSTSHFISASELLAEHERRKSYSVNGGYSSGSPASTATVGAGGSIPDSGHPVEAVYANFDPRTKTYGTSNNKMSAQGVPPPEYSVSVGYDSYNLQNGGTAISGYYPGAESDASSSADPLQQRGGYVPMYHPQQQPAQQTWIGYDPHQYGTLQSPSSQLAPSERGGSLNGTLSKGPPPVVPPKPRGPPILDESHSSSGSDRKIWTATQV